MIYLNSRVLVVCQFIFWLFSVNYFGFNQKKYNPVDKIKKNSQLSNNWQKTVRKLIDGLKQCFFGRLIKYQVKFLQLFLSEVVEAGLCYFFQNWLMKFKCPDLLNILGTMIQENYWPFYPSEPFTLARFNMRHPVGAYKMQQID